MRSRAWFGTAHGKGKAPRQKKRGKHTHKVKIRGAQETNRCLVNADQKGYIISYMEKHKHLARSCITKLGPRGDEKAARMWEEIAKECNELGRAKRTAKQWKNYWTRMRLMARMKKMRLSQIVDKSGKNNPGFDLTPSEQRIVNIFGKAGLGTPVYSESGYYIEKFVALNRAKRNEVKATSPANSDKGPTLRQVKCLVEFMNRPENADFAINLEDDLQCAELLQELTGKGPDFSLEFWKATWNKMVTDAMACAPSNQFRTNMSSIDQGMLEVLIRTGAFIPEPSSNFASSPNVAASQQFNIDNAGGSRRESSKRSAVRTSSTITRPQENSKNQGIDGFKFRKLNDQINENVYYARASNIVPNTGNVDAGDLRLLLRKATQDIVSEVIKYCHEKFIDTRADINTHATKIDGLQQQLENLALKLDNVQAPAPAVQQEVEYENDVNDGDALMDNQVFRQPFEESQVFEQNESWVSQQYDEVYECETVEL